MINFYGNFSRVSELLNTNHLNMSYNYWPQCIASILSPLVGHSEHHIKNSQDFVKSTNNLTLSKDETITSYDVSALFTCIPPEDAVTVVKDYLTRDKELGKRTPLTVDQVCDLLCLKSTYFSFYDQCPRISV